MHTYVNNTLDLLSQNLHYKISTSLSDEVENGLISKNV